MGQLKLNVYRVSCGNLGAFGGGGLIQDYQGKVLVGFTHFYAHVMNIIAECRTFFDGLHLC